MKLQVIAELGCEKLCFDLGCRINLFSNMLDPDKFCLLNEAIVADTLPIATMQQPYVDLLNFSDTIQSIAGLY